MTDNEGSSPKRAPSLGLGLGNRVAKLFLPTGAAGRRDRNAREWFNPEDDIEQKRDWAARQAARSSEGPPLSSPTSPSNRMYEHFCVVGLPPDLNITKVSADIRTYHNARETGGTGVDSITPAEPSTDGSGRPYGLRGPALPAQVIYSFPDPMPDDLAANVAAFCHPHGVRPELLERTASMSALNEVVYGQSHQSQPDQSFVFLMQVATPGDPNPKPLYGVCSLSRELVHRRPALSREDLTDDADPFSKQQGKLSRYLIAAPRCYCLLSRLPFFSLHFRVLNTILGLERLDRATAFAEELVAASLVGVSPQADASLLTASAASTEAYGYCSEAPTEACSTTDSSSVRGTLPSGYITPSGGEPGDESFVKTTPSGATGPWASHEHQTAAAGSEDVASNNGTLRGRTRLKQRITGILGVGQGREHEVEAVGLLVRASSATSQGSESATPHAPLIPSTPFFTPAAGFETGAGGSRRLTRHHDSSPAMFPALSSVDEHPSMRTLDRMDRTETGIETATPSKATAQAVAVARTGEGTSNQEEIQGRLEGVRQVLDKSMAELNARLAPSPNIVPDAKLQPGPHRARHERPDLTPEESFATARQTSSPDEIEMGGWVGAEETVARASSTIIAAKDPRRATPTPQRARGAESAVAALHMERLCVDDARRTGSGEAGETCIVETPGDGGGAPTVTVPTNAASFDPSCSEVSYTKGSQRPCAALEIAGTPVREGVLGRGSTTAGVVLPKGSDVRVGNYGNGDASPGHEPDGGSNNGPGVLHVTAVGLDLSRPLHGSDVLRVYFDARVPRPGQLFEFQPDPALQAAMFRRPELKHALRQLGLRREAPVARDVDAAQNLGPWAVAALCRCLSLESVLTFITTVLLERQVVVFCPSAGFLSGVILSLLPLLLPFSWQSLLLPVLPAIPPSHLDLLEAPVPFVVGVVYKTPEVRSRCGSLVRVNAYKDKVRNAGSLPALPQASALAEALAGPHAELRRAGHIRGADARPAHVVTDAQEAAAAAFTATLQSYLRGLVSDLKGYTITDVSAGSEQERVSVLLKDSFVDSFPPRDRVFMKQFVETQMFSVYCDSVL